MFFQIDLRMNFVKQVVETICAMVKSRFIGDGHPTFNRNPYNGYINPYYWVDDHPLLYGNNGSLDPGSSEEKEITHLEAGEKHKENLFGYQPFQSSGYACWRCFFLKRTISTLYCTSKTIQQTRYKN